MDERKLLRQAEHPPLCRVQRLGINTFRLFTAASASTVMGSIGGLDRYGQDLNGHFVTNAAQYEAAVALIRTPKGQWRP